MAKDRLTAWETLFARALENHPGADCYGRKALRTAFSGLDTLEFKPGYEECIRIVEDVLDKN